MDDLTRRGFLVALAVGPSVSALRATDGKEGLPQNLDKQLTAMKDPVKTNRAGGRDAGKPVEVAEHVFENLVHLPYLREHFGWEFAVAGHSMYMLIDEDRGVPVIGERTQPWGAPNASIYVQRIGRNLAALGEIPRLRLTYDFPGYDIESIAERFPDILAKMQAMHQKGVFDFVNGTYSSPHLQVLSSESNWRQFEYGLAVFKKLFNKEIKLYAFQEVSQHVQLPQLLQQFGYKMLSMSPFQWAMKITEGPFLFESCYHGTDFVHGDQFVKAVALDGTALPAFLMEPVGPTGNANAQQNVKTCIQEDLYGPSPVWPYFPDLREVNRKFYDEMSVLFDFVLLESALAKRIKVAPPRAKAQITTTWSYAEGVWAEELLRTNWESEQTAVLTETVQAMGKAAGSRVDRSVEINAIWHTIIKYQCHDVNWIEVTDLRRKAINYLKDGNSKCRKIMQSLASTLTTTDSNSLAIFNGVPQPRKVFVELPGTRGLGGGPEFQQFEGKSFGVRELPPGGYRSFAFSKESSFPSKAISLPKKIVTDYYATVFDKEGLIAQIRTQNRELLRPIRYLGGELRVMIDQSWVDNRSADCRFYEGPVCYVLVRTSVLGQVPLVERYFFFRKENFIRAELEFDFSGNTMGHFWLDETKVNVYYPTTGSEIYYDIPFGYVEGRENMPLFAHSWLYCGGLAYVNWGTVKHWVRDGVIANVLAWGGNSFSNRLDFDFWAGKQQYDIRLYGKQVIKYALIPYDDFNGNRIVRDVTALTSPVFTTKGQGERSFFAIKDGDLAVTAIYWKDGQVWARGYQLPAKSGSRYRNWEIFNTAINNLS